MLLWKLFGFLLGSYMFNLWNLYFKQKEISWKKYKISWEKYNERFGYAQISHNDFIDLARCKKYITIANLLNNAVPLQR